MARRFTWSIALFLCLVLAVSAAPRIDAATTQVPPHHTSHKASASKASARRTTSRSTSSTAAARRTASRALAARATSSRLTVRKPAADRTSSAHIAATTARAHAVRAVRRTRRHVTYERFTASSFTDDPTLGDVTAGEDPVVRAAAIEALGDMNGTALAIEPSSGRILAMVNQKLAFSSGAEPCSTIKLAVALAALDEGLVTRDTPVNLGGHYTVDLTKALAMSINPYFETLGRHARL